MNKDDRNFLKELEDKLQDFYWELCDAHNGDAAAFAQYLAFRIYCYLNPDYDGD